MSDVLFKRLISVCAVSTVFLMGASLPFRTREQLQIDQERAERSREHAEDMREIASLKKAVAKDHQFSEEILAIIKPKG